MADSASKQKAGKQKAGKGKTEGTREVTKAKAVSSAKTRKPETSNAKVSSAKASKSRQPASKQHDDSTGLDLVRHRQAGHLLTNQTAFAIGQRQREVFPLQTLAALPEREAGFDLVSFLQDINQHRRPELIPLRNQRMAASAFTFFRGVPALMAHDHGQAAHSGLLQQICGDCHLLNFGGFASPERNLLFGVNDFDETLIAPFEWDLKRLVASIAIACRVRDWPRHQVSLLVEYCIVSYLNRLQVMRTASPLAIWYDREDENSVLEQTHNPAVKAKRAKAMDKGRQSNSQSMLPKLTEQDPDTGRRQFVDEFPACFHPAADDPFETHTRQFLQTYQQSLPPDRQILLARYELTDIAMRVVGVGSVGTRCAIALFEDGDHEPLILQIKEARPASHRVSGQPVAEHDGERVVLGQKMMQAASDIFLGWATDSEGREYFVRQLKDMKVTVDLEDMDEAYFAEYLRSCGRALGHAHGKAGSPDALLGYVLGTLEPGAEPAARQELVQALTAYAHGYADRNANDYARYMQAVQAGHFTLPQDQGNDGTE